MHWSDAQNKRFLDVKEVSNEYGLAVSNGGHMDARETNGRFSPGIGGGPDGHSDRQRRHT